MAALRVDMNELELAFETAHEHAFNHYLDRQTGQVLAVPGEAYIGDEEEEMDAALELIEADPERFVELDSDLDLRPSLDDARAFAGTVDDEDLRRRLLVAAGAPRGAFRRFLDVLHEELSEVERWHHTARQRLRENIAAWLAARGVEILYEPLPPWRPRFDVRRHLLAGAAAFVQRVRQIEGVTRIALIGSMATPKKAPNGVELLVTVATEAIVPTLAAAGRKLQGHAQQINRGADVFLADAADRYLGRTCPWRECGPGIRRSCEAQHCGGHLYDDLHVVTLPREVIAAPALVLWPEVAVRGDVPADVMEAFGLR